MTSNRTAIFTSNSVDWYSPEWLINRVEVLFEGEIDLDPCSPAKPTVKAKKHFTLLDDGLSKEWQGKVYVNPPYGRIISEWCQKVNQEYLKGHITDAVLLVPARTDTKWFQDWLCSLPHSVLFFKGRLSFGGINEETGEIKKANTAPFPNMLVYIGLNKDRFKSVFNKKYGIIYTG